ncbi:MAG: hypothetical protein QXK06_02465 [Candidatus Diapherotrites archaeon]
MNKKGQIAAIDFLFSLILVVLAIGYTFRIAEANDYSLKEEEIYRDLQRIGTAASELLVSSPEFTCEINTGGAGTTQYFPNCTNAAKLSTATKEKLGIPPQYKFRLLLNGALQAGEAANPIATSTVENIYSEERKVVVGSPATISALSGLSEGTIKLQVWKD